MKIVKIVLAILLVLIMAAVILAVVALSRIERAAKDAVEQMVPAVAGVSCKIDSISIQPFEAQVCIKNLVLGNLEDYTSEYSIALGKITLKLDPATIFDKKMVVEKICLEDVTINCEITPMFTTDSILEIIRHLNRAAEEESRMLAEGKAGNPAQSMIEKQLRQGRFQLNTLETRNIRLWIMVKGFPARIPLNVILPETGPMGVDGDGFTSLRLLNETTTNTYNRIHDFAMSSKMQILKNYFSSPEGAE